MLRFGAKATDEADFQKGLMDSWCGWSERIHPGRGMTTGIPDTMFQFIDGRIPDKKIPMWVPIELKVGEWFRDVLVVKEVRPAQIRWAKQLRNSGGASLFVCGIHRDLDRSWECVILPWDQVVAGQIEFHENAVTEVRDHWSFYHSWQKMLLDPYKGKQEKASDATQDPRS